MVDVRPKASIRPPHQKSHRNEGIQGSSALPKARGEARFAVFRMREGRSGYRGPNRPCRQAPKHGEEHRPLPRFRFGGIAPLGPTGLARSAAPSSVE